MDWGKVPERPAGTDPDLPGGIDGSRRGEEEKKTSEKGGRFSSGRHRARSAPAYPLFLMVRASLPVSGKRKKTPSSACLKGLHPVSWPIRCLNTSSVRRRAIGVAKAGLLTLPLLRRPSHFNGSKQWPWVSKRFPSCSKKGLGITAAGPFPIFTGFPIKPFRHLDRQLKGFSFPCQRNSCQRPDLTFTGGW